MGPMARVEILAGHERRRFWSEEQKRAILEEALTSGLTMADVARRHDIVPQQIYTWRRQLGLSAPVATDPTFLPVVVAASENAEPRCRKRDTAPKVTTRGNRPGRIEIRCTNGRVLKVEAGLDARTLKALIRSVEDA
jgi:transposase